MKSETQKTELKRALYLQGAFMLSDDSLNNEVINTEFQAIDTGLFDRIQQSQSQRTQQENKIIQAFKTGQKINLNLMRCF